RLSERQLRRPQARVLDREHLRGLVTDRAKRRRDRALERGQAGRVEVAAKAFHAPADEWIPRELALKVRSPWDSDEVEHGADLAARVCDHVLVTDLHPLVI